MQKNSIQTLSKLAVPFKSKGRFFNEKKTHLRSDFQRDRDRIIHSTSFRRLKHKTQVFVNTEGDHYRTRITHSIEVSQIARTIAKYLGLNDDLAELGISFNAVSTTISDAVNLTEHQDLLDSISRKLSNLGAIS